MNRQHICCQNKFCNSFQIFRKGVGWSVLLDYPSFPVPCAHLATHMAPSGLYAPASRSCSPSFTHHLVPLQLYPTAWHLAQQLSVEIQKAQGSNSVTQVESEAQAPALLLAWPGPCCMQWAELPSPSPQPSLAPAAGSGQSCPTPHLGLDDVPGILQPHVVLCVVQQEAFLQVLLGVLIYLSDGGETG